MLSDADIAALNADMESYRVERKSVLSKTTKKLIEEAICAFSNDLPGGREAGLVLVGVGDDGRPTGLTVDDDLLVSLTNIRSDGNILPFPTMHVRRSLLDGVAIAVVEVQPSSSPPVRLRGRTHVRVGPRKGIATREEERILTERRRAWDLPFDQRPVYGTSLDDLDIGTFQRGYLPYAVAPEVLRENHRSVAEQLTALHLASPDAIPTVTGLLVLGDTPATFIKGAYVQFIRFGGDDVTAPIVDRKELYGSLPQILSEMELLTRAHNRVATTVAGVSREIKAPDYPTDAMQQLLRNAVMHRSYDTSHAPVQWYWFDDRIEIHNPGGLFGRATPETFGEIAGNDYRNPTLAGALRVLGLVQQFGMGIPLARRACRDNGNAPPAFVFGPSNFAVTIRRRGE